MDPTTLIGPSSPLGYPAPYWFLVFFKVLGFTLHIVPMSLWYAGIILAMLLYWRGGDHAKQLSSRLMKQMPIMVALGVNFGIVPLLFIQVAYYKVFYPATILMAWPWLSIVVLLTVAYYGVYIYARGLKTGDGQLAPWRRAVGWVTALLFIVMGFLFTNGLSLMTNVSGWQAIWQRTSIAGAPLGIALNTDDPTLWPRWLMMFGLALTTAAAYIVVDTSFFARKESDEYNREAMSIALKVYTVGMIWFAVMGSWYVFGAWPTEQREMMLSAPLMILTVLTAISPGLPWLLILVGRRGVTRTLALAIGGAQFGVVALNAVSRQVAQNAELNKYLDVTAERVATQWSPLILFLVLFVAGVGVIVWMVRKVIAAGRQPVAHYER
jgi:cytochrome bd-type quinol oxidase subunit 2